MHFIFIIIIVIVYLWLAHFISYNILKNRILKSRKWDLNICCGKTNGKGINADIKKHSNVPNFKLIKNIYKLPFKNKEFKHTLCSHTIEHVDNPEKFFKELKRVSKNVTIVIPPLYDLSAALQLFEHKWLFLTFKKKHNKLPKYIKLPFTSFIHKNFKQINHA